MDIGGWLRSLGLGQYETVFRENGIEADVLHDLTDQDLEKLGGVAWPSPQTIAGDRRAKRCTCGGQLVTPALGRHPSAETDHRTAADLHLSRNRRRTPACHGDVLRSGGFDGYRREA